MCLTLQPLLEKEPEIIVVKNVTRNITYPRVPHEILTRLVGPSAIKVWNALGPYEYNDGGAECGPCFRRPLTNYLNKGYFLGEFSPDSQLRHGRGVWISNNFGEVYEGYWFDDLYNGQGRWVQLFGGNSYTGDFL